MIDAHLAEALVRTEPRRQPQLVRLHRTVLDNLAAGHVRRPHARVERDRQEGQRDGRKSVVHQAEYGWVQQQTLFGCSATRHSGGSGDYDAGFHYEIGFNKEVEVTDDVTVGADWNVSFANRDYQAYLYGTKSSGFAGTTLKLYSAYAITEWVSLQATIAYTGVLNDDARDEMDELGSDYDLNGHKYPRDILWGGVSLKFEF